jgi:RNA polymerase sigma-70 factor (ECF subfamily)
LLERDEIRTLIRAKIDELPDGYRNVLLLRDIEEMTGAETAEQLGITSNAVKVRLHRARQALRELLAPHLLEADS